MNRRWRSGSPLADVALLGIAVNLAALVVSPLMRPDLDLWRDSLSYYAVGPWSLPQSLAFVALGIAAVALALGLRMIRADPLWQNLCTVLLVIAGLCSLGLFVFPMGTPGPRTFIGDLHQTAGTIGGVALLIATLAFALAVRRTRQWSSLVTPAIVALLLAATGALLSQLALWYPELGIPMGATMRLVAVPLILFWGAVALRLRVPTGTSLIRSAGET